MGAGPGPLGMLAAAQAVTAGSWRLVMEANLMGSKNGDPQSSVTLLPARERRSEPAQAYTATRRGRAVTNRYFSKIA